MEVQVGQVVMYVQTQQDKLSGHRKNRTLRFSGSIGQQQVLILLDSASAGTFISQEMASKIQQPISHCESIKFLAADGASMISDSVIQ